MMCHYYEENNYHNTILNLNNITNFIIKVSNVHAWGHLSEEFPGVQVSMFILLCKMQNPVLSDNDNIRNVLQTYWQFIWLGLNNPNVI